MPRWPVLVHGVERRALVGQSSLDGLVLILIRPVGAHAESHLDVRSRRRCREVR